MPSTSDEPGHSEQAPGPLTRVVRNGWVPSIALIVLIVALTLAFMAGSSAFKAEAERTGADAGPVAGQRMPAIEQPYSGQKPERPGDRGGWEQLALLGLIVAALGGGTLALMASSRRARRARTSSAPTRPATTASTSGSVPAPRPTSDGASPPM